MNSKSKYGKEPTRKTIIGVGALVVFMVVVTIIITTNNVSEVETKYTMQIRLEPLNDEPLPSVIEIRDADGWLIERMTTVRGADDAFAESTSGLDFTMATLEGTTIDTGDHLITLHESDFAPAPGDTYPWRNILATYGYDDYIVHVTLWEVE